MHRHNNTALILFTVYLSTVQWRSQLYILKANSQSIMMRNIQVSNNFLVTRESLSNMQYYYQNPFDWLLIEWWHRWCCRDGSLRRWFAHNNILSISAPSAKNAIGYLYPTRSFSTVTYCGPTGYKNYFILSLFQKLPKLPIFWWSIQMLYPLYIHRHLLRQSVILL